MCPFDQFFRVFQNVRGYLVVGRHCRFVWVRFERCRPCRHVFVLVRFINLQIENIVSYKAKHQTVTIESGTSKHFSYSDAAPRRHLIKNIVQKLVRYRHMICS